MIDLQNCWHCHTPHPSEDLRGWPKSEDLFQGRICVQCRIKESLRKEIRQAQNTLEITQSVTEALDGWKPFGSWASSHSYELRGELSQTLKDLKVFTRSHSRRFAIIWLYLGCWYGGIVSLSSDGITLVPVEGRWRMGGYISPVSAAAHALYYLGITR